AEHDGGDNGETGAPIPKLDGHLLRSDAGSVAWVTRDVGHRLAASSTNGHGDALPACALVGWDADSEPGPEGSRGAPQSPQKHLPAGLKAPQLGQPLASGDPHQR